MNRKYQIVVNPVDVTEGGNLSFLSRIDTDDYSFDFIDVDINGNEIYEGEINEDFIDWMEQQLDQTDGVVSYTEL